MGLLGRGGRGFWRGGSCEGCWDIRGAKLAARGNVVIEWMGMIPWCLVLQKGIAFHSARVRF